VNLIYFGDNLHVLPRLDSGSIDLIYIDPPFNTGRRQQRTRIRVSRDAAGGDRRGFQDARYRTTVIGRSGFAELFVHLDCREAHYVKVLLDEIFGRDGFVNEIIWAYDYGGRSRRRWPAKHDTLLWYARTPSCYTFRYDEIDRIPYMAPGLVGPEKAARGKTPTDVWWHTVVPTSGPERTGYATQKPLGLVSRIVRVHSNPGDLLLDFFAGSGTLGEAAARLGRRFILVDNNPQALAVMRRRLAFAEPRIVRVAGEAPPIGPAGGSPDCGEAPPIGPAT
jgi:site-specific DNA-methyltransferase (adenine-specific)